ncbi:hypothetical protein TSOC_003106 [Tetrabaena socialis]|uniref:Uncharacterized protein n=1 Tax=Tetrabaena socialis TaxID=47790 RepID=A0A2J8ACE2_9CHLO|nr:hypothetical protein TSOC_003106 [Tetrabaena socialis]|eukprot:PNH10189.1 hypothetical protein TSOC_003106 [Tetrabaena socialis]
MQCRTGDSDAYMPVSVEWFVERSQLNLYSRVTGAGELHELDQATDVARLIPSGKVTVEKLLDWEHLTVRIDAASLELQGVWYNAHRNIEGEWCPASRVPRTPCGRIVGFVAINGHGIYPHCGVIPRLFLLANDRTSRSGPVWSPRRLLRLCGLAHGSAVPVVLSRGCSLPYVPPGASSGCCLGGTSRGAPATAAPSQQVAVRQHSQAVTDAAVGVDLQLYGSSEVLLQGSAACSDGGGPRCRTHVVVESAACLDGGGPGCRTHVVVESAACSDGGGPGCRTHDVVEAVAVPCAAAAAAAEASASGERLDGLGVDGAVSVGDGGHGVFALPTVVHDASAWQRYRGRWGTIVSATQQGWFLGPEPPVSRGLLRRLCLPCAPGTGSLPARRLPQTAAAASVAVAVATGAGAGVQRRSTSTQQGAANDGR